MLSRKQLPLIWITLLIVLCLLNVVVAKKHRHDDDDDEDDDDYEDHDDDDHEDKDNDDKKVETDTPEFTTPEFTTPSNKAWLEGFDFSNITDKVRPIGSGVCEDAKCDGTDNEECFESCGNMATADDIYGCHTNKTWALTFDDGPSNFTTELLDILDAANIKATFVVMGAHAKQYPDIIRRAFQSGHQIASHTYSHPHLMSLTNEQIIFEIKATEEAIKEAIGVRPRYIRPPYGEADTRVKAILKQLGYKVLMWNVDPIDYNVHMLNDGADRIQRAFDKATDGSLNQLNVHQDPGFISLQHDLYKNSIAQVPMIIKKLQIKGYNFMTAANCVGDNEPHERDASAVIVNAQSAESENEMKEGEHQPVQLAQESSAKSFTYSIMTFVLAAVGFSSYFI